MHGLLLLDKPAGMTSHDCVRRVRKLFGTRKVGHAGTLDPLATGVLPIAIGSATKILQFLLAENKSYRATFSLGVTTDTLDSDGQVELVRKVPPVSLEILDSVCQRFRGVIDQKPPMFSALKKNGVPLYKLARQGQEVERESRSVHISRLDVISCVAEEVTIEVDCSKGTYIRSLAGDIGEQLGCGAHITSLRRLRTGAFPIEECWTFESIENIGNKTSCLLPLPVALRGYPSVALDETAISQLRFGIPPASDQVLAVEGIETGALVSLMNGPELMAMARYEPSRSKEKRGDFELIRVFVSH